MKTMWLLRFQHMSNTHTHTQYQRDNTSNNDNIKQRPSGNGLLGHM